MRFIAVLMLLFSNIEAEEPCLYFTSELDVAEKFIEKVKAEKKSIRMASHRLSDLDVIQSLIEAHQRRVSVEVIVDSVSISKRTPLTLLVKEGIPVFVWDAESFPKKKNEAPRRMHHGFCVFGSNASWTGLHSFSLKSRSHHFEHSLFLQDEKISKGFLKEFDEIKKKHAVPFSLHIEQKKVRS